MEEELEQARESYLEEDEAQELGEHGQLGASVRLSLLKEVAPGRLEELSNSWPFRSVHEDLLSVTEYNALQTLSIARNYDGIAHAQAEKPKRQIDRDVKIPEQPVYIEGVVKLRDSEMTRLLHYAKVCSWHTSSTKQTCRRFSLSKQPNERRLS